MTQTKNLYSPRHFLQSQAWIDFQTTLGRETFEVSGRGWSFQAILERGELPLKKLSKRLYAPYGPTADSLESLKKALAALKQLARDTGASYVRVEPYPYFEARSLKKLGLHKNSRDSQPARTLVLDLSPSQDTLEMAMTSLNRRVWRRHAEFGISFEVDNSDEGLDDFMKIMDDTAQRTGSIFRSRDYLSKLRSTLGNRVGIAFAVEDKQRLAGVFYVDDLENKTRFYMYAGSQPEARKHSCNSALGAYLIIDAKNKGLKFFDFFGVSPPEDKSHKWAGFSAFKRSFGGEDVIFSGTWELPVNHVAHSLTRLARAGQRLKKRP